MKIAALVWSVLAIAAALIACIAYQLGLATICFDVCLPLSAAGPELAHVITGTLGPSVLCSLLAWILSLFYLYGQRRRVWFSVLAVTPLIVVLAALLTLYLTAGSLTPIADTSLTIVPPEPLISRSWLSDTPGAIIWLAVWPIMSFLAALTRQQARASRA
jgi:hypothetical protein